TNPPVERRDPVMIAEPPAPVLAVLDRTHDAQWEGASGAVTAGTQLHEQTLELKRGAAQLTFSDGATVVLEAPARIHLESSNRARLERGRLFAQVPASAVGFTIDTPATRVVDLGTAFS